jgi:FkbM family methyltransferase
MQKKSKGQNEFIKSKELISIYSIKIFLNKYLPVFLYKCVRFLYRTIRKKVKKKKLKNFKNVIFKNFKLDDLKFSICLDPKNGFVDEEIFLNDCYEPEILNLIKKHSNKKNVFLDIGANIGQHSLFSSFFFKEVISFEPINKLYLQIKKSIKQNNIKNIKVHKFGLSNNNETKNIKINFSNIGSSSILDTEEKFDLEEKIKLKKLDLILKNKKIDFIKMDIEGYEYFAFLGMENLIGKYKPKIIFEFSPFLYDKIDKNMSKKILTFLKSFKYNLLDLDSNEEIKNIPLFLIEMNKNKREQTNIFCY